MNGDPKKEPCLSPSSSALSLTPEPTPPFAASSSGGMQRCSSDLNLLLNNSNKDLLPSATTALNSSDTLAVDSKQPSFHVVTFTESRTANELVDYHDEDENKDEPDVEPHILAQLNRSHHEVEDDTLVDGHAIMLEETSSHEEDENLLQGSSHRRRPSTIAEDNAPPKRVEEPHYTIPRILCQFFHRYYSNSNPQSSDINATASGFWALLFVTCATYVLTPLRDAIALTIGVAYMPQLTLASTVMAVFSSVPIGWLFEAPDPNRRRVWKRMGLTRGETQGTSLALFYRCFAAVLVSYALGFQGLEYIGLGTTATSTSTSMMASFGRFLYVAFYLIVHLMKLHCLSLLWGVTTETMEYEDVARKQNRKMGQPFLEGGNKMRLKRLAMVGFGGTLGGILGSFLASSTAQTLRLPGLLVLAACLLEVAAQLSIELGRIMRKHWEEQQQLFQSTNSLISLDPSMRRSTSAGSMKRISSGNSLNRIRSATDLNKSHPSSGSLHSEATAAKPPPVEVQPEDTFSQRMLRGVTTILRSRLLMSIFTYNALYASTNVLLSFQRASLVANRGSTTVQADTAFLANINMASSAAIFALQASGVGAYIAHTCGPRGTLVLMPLVRFLGVLALAWWHRVSGGQPPRLLLFLAIDECCKVMNLAVAKPVRESLWRGLSNEARYEAKPIVDTLANRWGGGSAAFLVSFVDKTMYLLGASVNPQTGVRDMFGLTPVLFLCLSISAWWTAVSADLGHIRRRIDLELKKRQ